MQKQNGNAEMNFLMFGNHLSARRALLSPPLCSDRGQGGRVFGDIVDTFGPAVEGSDVDDCNPLSEEDDVEGAIVCSRAERDSLAAECFGDFDGATEEA